MSIFVSATSGGNYPERKPLEAGAYAAICDMVVDLGVQWQAQAPAATAEAEQKAHDEAASLAARARLADLARRRRQGGA